MRPETGAHSSELELELAPESAPFLGPEDHEASPPSARASLSQASDSSSNNDRHWSVRGAARRLYISHFLSTWNSRVFEFGSVLYLAAIFPGTLLPMSVYAMARGISAVLFSSWVGHYIDTGDRLKVVRLSIVLQRIVVAVSCAIFLLMLIIDLSDFANVLCVAVLSLLACVEKLCSIMNLISVEKDWVIVVAHDNTSTLRSLNSNMRRIDLTCKLFGPFCIAFVDAFSTKVALLVNLAMNIASIGLEYYLIAQVYHNIPELQQPKARRPSDDSTQAQSPSLPVKQSWDRIKTSAAKLRKDTKLYFHHRAVLPSFAGALLYFTVLSFSGQMVTYLLASGYSSSQVATARTISVLFEVSATWMGPWLMTKIGPVRAGLWFASWQLGCLLAGTAVFWSFIDNPFISASGLVGGTILSRIGLWGFDLCSQILIQEAVEAEHRGAFSAVEASWQNIFELCSYAMTIVLSSPQQFRWPASTSVFAVACAWALYARFVRARRGHLLHLPDCLPQAGKGRRAPAEPLLENIRPRERLGV